MDGGEPVVLVDRKQGYQGLIDVDEKSGVVVYQASNDPTQAHLFRRTPKATEALGKNERGFRTAVFSKDHSLHVQTFLSLGEMPRTTVHRADGTEVGELPSVAERPPFVPQAEVGKHLTGQNYYAAIIRPRAFEPKKKYPVINHVYGGPKHNQVEIAMNRLLLDQWIADQGFIVVAVDGRGTPGLGRDWEREIGKKFGSVPLAGQVEGLRSLGEKFPEMDMDRVGIYGWSFGGYMAALAAMKEPGRFKAAVAGAPVVDWLDYDTHYTERYLGLPETDAEAYKEGSLLTYAKALNRPLLLVHGTADDNVFFRHTLKLTDALFRAGKDFEVLPLPALTHMVPDPEVTQRLYARIAGHFRKHLGRPTEAR